VNIGAPWPDLHQAESRVLAMQTKLHQWAMADPDRRFDDLANLVYDPAFLVMAWGRVRGNKGARTAGVDGAAPRSIALGAGALLDRLRAALKAGRFVPQQVREKTIPKANGKVRSLGIPTTADRIVQAALKLVLEPIFEADFKACSYGFRPGAAPRTRPPRSTSSPHPPATMSGCSRQTSRRASTRSTTWPHGPRAASDRRQARAGLGGGVLAGRDPHRRGPGPPDHHRHPQGGILSPLLANIALSVLDEHFAGKWAALGPEWKRVKHRRAGGAAVRLVRYADDFVVMVAGQRGDAEALRAR